MNRIIFCLLVLVTYIFTLTPAEAKKIPSERPKLIVNIIVDQMKYSYIHKYWNDFSDNGFKKLATEGAFLKNASYNYLFIQSAVGCATISTGTTPTYNGITGDYWYDRLKQKVVFCVSDDDMLTTEGSYDAGKVSPQYLLTTTVGDELRLSNEFRSKVYGVSLKAHSAILTTGHNANASYWLDGVQGNWITSSYYMDSLPSWVKEFNSKKYSDIYLNRNWQPLHSYNEKNNYDSILVEGANIYSKRLLNFSHEIGKKLKNQDKYSVLKETPFGNTFTFDFSKAVIVNEGLGLDEFPDLISICFNANGLINQKYGQESLELKDAYIRFDNELAQFIEFIDENIGIENTMIILTSDMGSSYDPKYLENYKIPTGYYNSNQSVSLLKSYLNVIYGEGKWVLYYDKNQIFLNRHLIEDSNIKLEEFQTRVAQFMIQFSGVANAIAASSLESSNFTTGIFNKFQNSYNQKRSGDVLINLEPGWLETNEGLSVSGSSYSYDTHVPLIWYGWKIKRISITRQINMTDIAPTISNLINIPYTNANTGNPIMEITD